MNTLTGKIEKKTTGVGELQTYLHIMPSDTQQKKKGQGDIDALRRVGGDKKGRLFLKTFPGRRGGTKKTKKKAGGPRSKDTRKRGKLGA